MLSCVRRVYIWRGELTQGRVNNQWILAPRAQAIAATKSTQRPLQAIDINNNLPRIHALIYITLGTSQAEKNDEKLMKLGRVGYLCDDVFVPSTERCRSAMITQEQFGVKRCWSAPEKTKTSAAPEVVLAIQKRQPWGGNLEALKMNILSWERHPVNTQERCSSPNPPTAGTVLATQTRRSTILRNLAALDMDLAMPREGPGSPDKYRAQSRESARSSVCNRAARSARHVIFRKQELITEETIFMAQPVIYLFTSRRRDHSLVRYERQAAAE